MNKKVNLIKWISPIFLNLFETASKTLEFRAKLIAAVIGTNKDIDDCEEILLKKTAKEIYNKDISKVNLLIKKTEEYVEKIVQKNGLDINELILSIESDLKENRSFYQQIDIQLLKKFLNCSKNDEQTRIIQTRVIEFLENELDYFNKLR